MTNKTEWSANETQKAFLNVLGDYPHGITLLELRIERGIEFKTGSINTLVSKGLVITDGTRNFDCEVQYQGKVVGRVTKKGTVYKLAVKE